jgi:hypothetical protein
MKILYRKSNIVLILVLGMFISGFLFTSVSAAITYRLTLTKGTEELTVISYDEEAWNSTVDSTLNPSDWFEGDSNITNAKSKITLKGWTTDTWTIYDWLISVFLPQYYTSEEVFLLLGVMDSQGYNETTINANYSLNYPLWYGLRSVWNFTDNGYEENPSYRDGIIILQNPSDYKTVLEDYHNLTSKLNANIAIQMAGYSFVNITADDFLWQLVFSGFGIAEPQSEYLAEVINELGSENVTNSGNTLIFERNGLANYTVEISYGIKGMMSSFTVKDAVGTTIFQITSSNSDWIFYLILIIISSIAVVLVIFIIIRKRKLKR